MPRRFHVTDRVRREKRVFLATPSTSGAVSPYFFSLIRSIDLLRGAGVSVDWMHLEGHCHVDDARNDLIRAFMESDCTDLVFIDADVGWVPEDLLRLVTVHRDVVAGIYPKKNHDEQYPCALIDGVNRAESDGLLEVMRVPTGFLRFSRAAIERLRRAETRCFLGSKDPPDRLPQVIVFERTFNGGNRISGDYSVSDKWRALGGRIYIDPEMTFIHEGPHEWSGSFGAHLRHERGLTLSYCLNRIRAGTDDGLVHHELINDWGNWPWSISSDLSLTCAMLARDGDGPILETGSGISTLVMGAAAPHREIWALEHDPAWINRVQILAKENDLHNIRLIYAPLVEAWYEPSEHLPQNFYLVLCDGPPRQLADRTKLLSKPVFAPGAILVMDDAEDVTAWEQQTGLKFNVFRNGRKPYAIVRLPGLDQVSAA